MKLVTFRIDTVTTASTEKKESVRAGRLPPLRADKLQLKLVPNVFLSSSAAAELHSGRRGSWASPHNHQILTQRRRTIQPVGSSPVSVFPNGAVNSAHGPTNSDPQMGALLTFMRGTPRPTGTQDVAFRVYYYQRDKCVGGKAGVSPEDFYPEHARKMTPHTPRHGTQRSSGYGQCDRVQKHLSQKRCNGSNVTEA